MAYVPLSDAPPYEWGFVWRPAAETARLRAFHQAALAHAARSSGDGWGIA